MLNRQMQVIAIASASIVLVVAGPLGAVILDQSQLEHHNYAAIDDEGYFAQTFTPAVSAQLDHVELLIGHRYVTSGGDDYELGPPPPRRGLSDYGLHIRNRWQWCPKWCCAGHGH